MSTDTTVEGSRAVDHHKRTIVKAITYRVIATLTTFMLVLVFTGEWELSAAVGGLEVLSKMALYYGHERLWERFPVGRAS